MDSLHQLMKRTGLQDPPIPIPTNTNIDRIEIATQTGS